jgi:hypothetical protein
MFSRYLFDDLLSSIPYWPDEHRAAPLGTPDDVVHHEVYAMLLVLIVHVAIIAFFNTERKSEGPFIPWLRPRGFLAHFL